MASNRIKTNGRELSVTISHPTSPSSGQPVRLGQATGVALTDERTAGDTTVDFGPAVYDLSTKGIDDDGNSVVAAGDQLFYVDSDISDGSGFLSKKDSGWFFGFALEAVLTGATTTIEVLCLPSPGPGTADILPGTIGTSELAAGALAASATGRAIMADGYFDTATALAKFAADSIDNTFLLDAVADGAFAADASTRALFASGIWEAGQLATDSVTAVKIADDILTGAKVAVVADDNVIGGISVVHRIDIADGAGSTDVTLTHATRVIDVRVVKTATAGGAGDTIQVLNSTNAITDAIVLNVSDKVTARAGTIDDAFHEIAASGILRCTAANNTNNACTVYVSGIRIT